MTIAIFGHAYRRARKDYICWSCERVITKGSKYFRTSGTVDGKMFSVKHCRENCECTSDALNQNAYLANAVFHPTLRSWEQRK